MIKGILSDKAVQFDGAVKNKYLIVVCPHCGSEHYSLVSRDGLVDRGGFGNTWLYKVIEVKERTVIIEVSPSYNNEKNCGWHSSNPWRVEVIKVTDDDNRSDYIKKWMRSVAE